MLCVSRASVRSIGNSIAAGQFSSIFSKISCSVPRLSIIVRDINTPVLFKREEKFRVQDKIPSDYQLIYRMKQSNLLPVCYWILYLSVPYLFYQVYHYMRPLEVKIDYSIRTLDDTMDNLFSTPLQATDTQFKCILAFSCIVFGALLVFTKRLVIRLYFNGERYIAVFINSLLPIARTNYEFTKVRVLTFTTFSGSFFRIGNRRAYLFQDDFRTPSDYFRFSDNFHKHVGEEIFRDDIDD